jgi:LPS sulfotransferase NodH
MPAREILLKLRDDLNSAYTRTLQKTYFRLFGHLVDQRFAIVGNARTGSNYLLDGLKTSPAIRMYHEIFASHNREVGKDFEKILSTVYQYESKSTKMVGFKVFYNHLTDEEWKKLMSLPDLKIIHLTRRNRLRTVISLDIAFKTGKWTNAGSTSGAEEKRIALDPQHLMERLEHIEAGETLTRTRFCDRPMLEVVYEDLVQSPHEVFAAIGTFLGVAEIDPDKIRLKRQNPEGLDQLIVNYDEIESVLKNTRFAEYLVN